MQLSPNPEHTHPLPSSHHTPAPGTLHNPPRPECRIQLPPLLPETTISSSYNNKKKQGIQKKRYTQQYLGHPHYISFFYPELFDNVFLD